MHSCSVEKSNSTKQSRSASDKKQNENKGEKVTQFQEETEIILLVVELAIRIREGLKIVTQILKEMAIIVNWKKRCMYSSAGSIVNLKLE